LVVIRAIIDGQIPLYGMARVTRAVIGSGCKLPAVLIAMAISASAMSKADCHVSAFVASDATDSGVCSLQRIIGFRMVEFVARDSLESFRSVAIGAACSEFPGMNIGVARRAILVIEQFISGVNSAVAELGKMAGGRRGCRNQSMTLNALHLHMPAGQWKCGASVIKPGGRFPSIGIVATPAIGRELAAVFIGMAIVAGSAQPHEGAFPVQVLRLRHRGIGDQ
jgi:hypothetical protein